jgi:hypothetical protein
MARRRDARDLLVELHDALEVIGDHANGYKIHGWLPFVNASIEIANATKP